MAQTNVYSLNAVGYITVTLPAASYTMLTDPLVETPDNTLNTVLPNTAGAYKKAKVYFFSGGSFGAPISGLATSWSDGGGDVLAPGHAVFFYNSTATAMTATFVGQVPTGSLTNTLTPGYNLVSSIVPAQGDLVTNPITLLPATKKDFVYTYDPTAGYSAKESFSAAGWSAHPTLNQTGYGFYFFNNQATNENWVENFTINP